MHATVTGATGVIGPTLVHHLIAAGYQVRVLSRRSVPDMLLPDGVEVVRGDITDSEAVYSAVTGSDVVFHLAAKLHVNQPGEALAGEYRRVNTDGTRIVAEAAGRSGVRRLVFFSTIAVYGPGRLGTVYDESSPAVANTLYGASKREAEEIVLGLRDAADQPLCVVLRIAGVYGPRLKGNYERLIRSIRRGWFIPVGRGMNRRTLIYDRDVAAAALLAAEHPAAAGMIFNVTDGAVHPFRDIVAVISELLGRRPPRLYLPVRWAQTATTLIDAVLAAAGRSALATPLLEKLTEDMAVSGARIQEVLGFRPEFDLRSGWRDTITQMTAMAPGRPANAGSRR